MLKVDYSSPNEWQTGIYTIGVANLLMSPYPIPIQMGLMS